MIVVTGGAGFIGANLIQKINATGNSNIIVVDNVKKNKKNLDKINYADYIDKNDFISIIEKKKIFNNMKCIIHLGACSDTTETNWDYLNYNNYVYSKILYEFSLKNNCQFIYASSASVYGNNSGNILSKKLNQRPLNLYGKSKLKLDKFFFEKNNSNIIGLRFFNVYGEYENHKKKMQSPVSKFYNQLKSENEIKVFKFLKHKEPMRDFIYIKDAVNMTLFLKRVRKRGIYNIGTGKSKTFIQIAQLLIKKLRKGEIKYIEFPHYLKNKYQYYTRANITEIIKLGYKKKILDIEKGINSYIKKID